MVEFEQQIPIGWQSINFLFPLTTSVLFLNHTSIYQLSIEPNAQMNVPVSETTKYSRIGRSVSLMARKTKTKTVSSIKPYMV